jgi:hypothetical protein
MRMGLKPNTNQLNRGIDVDSVDGLKLWLKQDTSTIRVSDGSAVENSGDLVRFWDDSSGRSNDFTQSSSSRQPRFDKDVTTPGLLFDGSETLSNTDRMSCSSTISALDFTLFVVLDLTNASPTDEMFICEFGNTKNRISLFQGGDADRIQLRFDNGTTAEICDLEDLSQDIPTTAFLLTVKRNSATQNNIDVRFDGVDVTDLSDIDTGTDANNDSAGISFVFDTLGVGGANSLEYQGFISEVVFYDTALADLTMSRVEKDIMTRNNL